MREEDGREGSLGLVAVWEALAVASCFVGVRGDILSVCRCIPIQKEECWGHKGSLQGQTLLGNITFFSVITINRCGSLAGQVLCCAIGFSRW